MPTARQDDVHGDFSGRAAGQQPHLRPRVQVFQRHRARNASWPSRPPEPKTVVGRGARASAPPRKPGLVPDTGDSRRAAGAFQSGLGISSSRRNPPSHDQRRTWWPGVTQPADRHGPRPAQRPGRHRGVSYRPQGGTWPCCPLARAQPEGPAPFSPAGQPPRRQRPCRGGATRWNAMRDLATAVHAGSAGIQKTPQGPKKIYRPPRSPGRSNGDPGSGLEVSGQLRGAGCWPPTAQLRRGVRPAAGRFCQNNTGFALPNRPPPRCTARRPRAGGATPPRRLTIVVLGTKPRPRSPPTSRRPGPAKPPPAATRPARARGTGDHLHPPPHPRPSRLYCARAPTPPLPRPQLGASPRPAGVPFSRGGSSGPPPVPISSGRTFRPCGLQN